MKISLCWWGVLFSGFLIFFGLHKTSAAQQLFDKSAFYHVMASEDTNAINNELKIVQQASPGNKDGYEGALLMKKAGLVSSGDKKLKLFKAGRIKLEIALLADSNNTEFYFLRLTIQEHAPKIVKYHSNLESDKLFIQKNFKSLSHDVQQAILGYCNTSKVIRAEDF